MEGAVREHLETHPLIEWARELSNVRGEMDRRDRDAALTVKILLRRLGGSAEFAGDADRAAEQGKLICEQTAHGFRLSVRD